MKKIFKYVIGIICISFGVSLVLKSEVGAGSYDALTANLANTVGLTIGVWIYIIGITLIIINYFLSGKFVITSFITSFLVGTMVDTWLEFIMADLQINTGIFSLVFFVLGLYILSLGVAFNIKSTFATAPYELIPLTFDRKFGIPYWKVKIINEFIIVLLAAIIGFSMNIGLGQVGFGTILISIVIGPMVNMSLKFISK